MTRTSSLSAALNSGLERAVGEVTVEPDRDAQAGEEVKEHRQPDIGPAQPPPSGQRDSGQHGEQRQYHEDLDQQLLTGRALSVEQWAGTDLDFSSG